jgi:hypothetical protein
MSEAKNRAYVQRFVRESMAIGYRLINMKIGAHAKIKGHFVHKTGRDDFTVDGEALHRASAGNKIQGPAK